MNGLKIKNNRLTRISGFVSYDLVRDNSEITQAKNYLRIRPDGSKTIWQRNRTFHLINSKESIISCRASISVDNELIM